LGFYTDPYKYFWGAQNGVEYVLKMIDGWAYTADAMPVVRV